MGLVDGLLKGTKFILELETELQRKVDGLYYEMKQIMNEVYEIKIE